MARFLDRVVSFGDGEAVCRAAVPAGSPFALEGRVSSFVALEVAAQAAAVLGFSRATGASGDPMGYLVGGRELHFAEGTFPAGEELIVSVRVEASNPPLLIVSSSVSWRDREIMSGVLSVYRGRPE